jgi:hypothetical protein
MRLCSIINVWADAVELLPYCVQNLADCGIDGIIVIWSEKSNYGEIEKDYFKIDCFDKDGLPFIHLFQREPFFNHPANCETDKRNFGLDQAKILGYTHFLTMDQDEFYEPVKFKKVREYIDKTGVKGIVCPSNVYFKSPTLTIGRDVTLVPFIHEIQPGIKHEMNRSYPYAFDDKHHIRIDPTRQLNIRSGVEYTEDVVMEHMSYVRKDIEKKIRNSTARNNIEKSTLRKDYANAKVGYYCEYYKSFLREAPNLFKIPDFSV